MDADHGLVVRAFLGQHPFVDFLVDNLVSELMIHRHLKFILR